jgi:hypothetical protein
MTAPADLPSPAPSPAPVPARSRRPLVIALIILVVVVGVGAVGSLVVAPRLCALTEPERHGLPCDAPLPAGARFASEQVSPSGDPIVTQTWVFTISPPYAAGAAQAYVDRLRQTGWSCAFTAGPPDNFAISALKGDTQLTVGGKPLLGPPARSITFSIDLVDTRSTGLKPPC